ncbi:hypothetical protein F4805DRAFT_435773 [Annulohypoxylon moriforme]|nr:hypothetical protein F4805DRAFT_435773 [Annulohypoxylon moriforme]
MILVHDFRYGFLFLFLLHLVHVLRIPLNESYPYFFSGLFFLLGQTSILLLFPDLGHMILPITCEKF